MTIFQNAIELDKYKYSKKVRNEVRRELGIDDDKFVIGHVGRFCYQKNQEFLLDVFVEVQKKNPDAVLMLVGNGKDRERIEEKARRLGLWEKILLLGCRSDVERLYQAMDMFVLPSRYEELPVVAVEAQAAGLPCVLSNKMTTEARITDNVMFMDIEDESSKWASQLINFLKYRKRDKTEMIKANGFCIEDQSGKLLKFYEKMINFSLCHKNELISADISLLNSHKI